MFVATADAKEQPVPWVFVLLIFLDSNICSSPLEVIKTSLILSEFPWPPLTNTFLHPSFNNFFPASI